MSAKKIPASEGLSEYVEKRSRFLGLVRHVSSEEEARQIIAEVKKQNYDARHNCWCYIIDGGPERYSDDGEPQGTAGIPMLEVFRREGVSDVVCVVTRYFGGVLLGAGGLFRAYSKAAKEALASAGTEEVIEKTTLSFSCPYQLFDRIRKETEALGASVLDTEYGENIIITASIAAGREEEFSRRIYDVSAGKVTVTEC